MRTIIIGFILLGFAARAIAEVDEMLIDPEILTRVVRIETFSEASQKRVSGSGFIVSQKLVSPLIRVFFLITSKQMVSDWNPSNYRLNKYNKYLDVYFFGRDSAALANPKKIPLFDAEGNLRDDILHLHDDDSVDIAVIYLHEDLSSSDGIALDSFDTSSLKPFDSIADSGITIGSRVFVLGYPRSITSTTRNLPLATFGFLSSVSGDLVTIAYPCDGCGDENTGIPETGGKILIIDDLMVAGNSGGPVLLPSQKKTVATPDRKLLEQHAEVSDNMVLGMLSGEFGGTGLSYSFSSEYIVEAIFQFLEDKGVTNLPRWPEAGAEQ